MALMNHYTRQPLKGAVVGFGKVAELAHLPAFNHRPEFGLVAAVDPLPERRARAQELLPHIRLYADVDTLLTREATLDFVDICSSPGSHTPLARAALQRGCHVLCEKPLTLVAQEFQELQEAATRNQAALVTVHNWKYAPMLTQTTKMIQDGAIGDMKKLQWEVFRTTASGGGLSRWRQEAATSLGGILVDHGWHAFYLLMGWAGAVPGALKAHLKKNAGNSPGVEVEAEVEMQFPTTSACLFLTWQASQRRNQGRLQGSKGEIILADDQLSMTRGEFLIESQAFSTRLSAGSHHPAWMQGVLDEFLEEIYCPDQRGQNFKEAEACGRLIRLAYRSHEVGGAWLRVESE